MNHKRALSWRGMAQQSSTEYTTDMYNFNGIKCDEPQERSPRYTLDYLRKRCSYLLGNNRQGIKNDGLCTRFLQIQANQGNPGKPIVVNKSKVLEITMHIQGKLLSGAASVQAMNNYYCRKHLLRSSCVLPTAVLWSVSCGTIGPFLQLTTWKHNSTQCLHKSMSFQSEPGDCTPLRRRAHVKACTHPQAAVKRCSAWIGKTL